MYNIAFRHINLRRSLEIFIRTLNTGITINLGLRRPKFLWTVQSCILHPTTTVAFKLHWQWSDTDYAKHFETVNSGIETSRAIRIRAETLAKFRWSRKLYWMQYTLWFSRIYFYYEKQKNIIVSVAARQKKRILSQFWLLSLN